MSELIHAADASLRGNEERRRALIDATLSCLSRYGGDGTSVRRIAEEAGVAPGLLTYYFSGKDELLAEAYRSLSNRLLASLERRASQAGPRAANRLRAFLLASLDPPFGESGALRIWVQLWGHILSNAEARRVHGDVYGAFRAALEALILACLRERGEAGEPAKVKRLAIGAAAILDGVWLERCLDDRAFGAREAQSVVWEFVAASLGLNSEGAVLD